MRRRKKCKSGKAGLRTRTDAMAKAHSSEQHYGTAMRVYLCPMCGQWHTSRKVRR